MNNKYVINDMKAAILIQDFPSVTVWNRLEGRPRAHNFDRALKAEVRDALWMLARQWQLGEFQGDDAASPVLAKLHIATTHLTRYQPARQETSQPFHDNVPLEAHVERCPIPFAQYHRAIKNQQLEQTEQKISFDLRLLMGRQWLKMLKTVTENPKDHNAYIAKYKIEIPAPTNVGDAWVRAHPEVWATLAAVAGRRMDGAELYLYLKSDSSRHATDGITLSDPKQKGTIDTLGQKFLMWFEKLFYQPHSPDKDAWLPERLEYQFAVSAPEGDHEKVLSAEEYYHGRLDWYNFDVDSGSSGLRATSASDTPGPQSTDTKTFIPTQVVFDGMPNTRWWTFEDRRTNLGDIKPDTTDISKLMLMEFGLVYANDWFLVPYTLPVGAIASIRGMAVTNVFGERFWIEAAGSGEDDAWQRWSMFTLNTKGNASESADTSMLLLPTVLKIQEGKPREQAVFIRDELSNMVWGIEKIIPLANGDSKSGSEAANELLKFIQKPLIENTLQMKARKTQLESISESKRTPAGKNELTQLTKILHPDPKANIRYQVMNTVPEHWIPFIPVHVKDDNREIQLQRAAMPRIIEGDPNPPQKVRPRTTLLREGLDQPSPTAYYVHEEEVPRTGIQVTQSFQRTRWRDGRVWVWLGVQKQIGRGEGSSGLRFDGLIDTKK